jgi:hypothetical protein
VRNHAGPPLPFKSAASTWVSGVFAWLRASWYTTPGHAATWRVGGVQGEAMRQWARWRVARDQMASYDTLRAVLSLGACQQRRARCGHAASTTAGEVHVRGGASWGGTEGRHDREGRTEVPTTALMTFPNSGKHRDTLSGANLALKAWYPAAGAACATAVLTPGPVQAKSSPPPPRTTLSEFEQGATSL